MKISIKNLAKAALLLTGLFLFSCDKEEEEEQAEVYGWECVNGECKHEVNGRYESQYQCNVNCETLEQEPFYTEGNGVRDNNGNFYKTIIINGKEWMAQNLRNENPVDYNPRLTYAPDGSNWGAAIFTNPLYRYVNDNPATKEEYGVLYNWYATQLPICPIGWRVPTFEEWKDLITFINPHQFWQQSFRGAEPFPSSKPRTIFPLLGKRA